MVASDSLLIRFCVASLSGNYDPLSVVAPVLWWVLYRGGFGPTLFGLVGGFPMVAPSPALSSVWWSVCDGSRWDWWVSFAAVGLGGDKVQNLCYRRPRS